MVGILEIVQAVFTILATVIGGAWVWFNYLSRREFKQRLESNVKAVVKQEKDRTHLLVECMLKSLGYAKVELEHSAIRVYVSTPYKELKDLQNGVRVDWQLVSTFKIFEQHHWIEFDETIRESEIVTIPGEEYLAFKLEMIVYTKRKLRRKSLEWNTSAIVFKDFIKGDYDEPT